MPLLGYNNNIPHKGQMYHVQTEDSGEKRPHVFTHLFADGGRIVKTTKTSYSKHVDQPNLEERVRSLMKSQHKAMVIALRDGEFDDVIEGKAAPIREENTLPPPGSTVPPAAAAEGTAEAANASDAAIPKAPKAPKMGSSAGPSSTPSPRSSRPPARRRPGGRGASGSYSFVNKGSAPPPKGASKGRGEDERKTGMFKRRRQSTGRHRGLRTPVPVAGGPFGSSVLSNRSLDVVVAEFLANADG